MSHLQIAERWLSAESRRRANFKQQLQNLEHNEDLGRKAEVEDEIETLLKKNGNPWRIVVEDVEANERIETPVAATNEQKLIACQS